MRWFSFLGYLGLFFLAGCASMSRGPANPVAAACFDLRYFHELALRTHVSYGGFTPETSARVAERFVAGIDPYEILLTDTERANFRSAALATDPTQGAPGCNALETVAQAAGAERARLQTLVTETLLLPEAAGELRSIALPKLPHHTPAQRDVALTRAVRHYRQVLLATDITLLQANALTLLWFEQQMDRLADPATVLSTFGQAFLRSLPGENTAMNTAIQQLEMDGRADPMLRALKPDWVPELTSLAAFGLEGRATDARAGDRIVGMMLDRGTPEPLYYTWIGESSLDAQRLRPVTAANVVQYRLLALRRDRRGVWRRQLYGDTLFGTIYDVVSSPGGNTLIVRADTLGVELATGLAGQITKHEPVAVVLDLRAATSPVESVVEAFVGLFLDHTRWGFVETRGGRVDERRSIGLAPVWTGPMVVIVGPNTGGPAEALALALQKSGRAVVVGQGRSAGASGAVVVVKIDQGRQLAMAFGKRFGPDGQPLDGVGVEPDVLVDGEALRVPPRIGPVEPLRAVMASEARAKITPSRMLASLPAATLQSARAAAKARAKDKKTVDRVEAAAVAVAEVLVREVGKK